MSMPALQPMIATIGKPIFRRFIQRIASEFESEFDWEPEGDEFAAKAFATLSRKDERTIAVRDRIYPNLFNIHTLSENPKDGIYYYQCITHTGGGVKEKWFTEFKLNTPAIQTMATWMLIEAPDLFEQLLTQSLGKCREANGGYKFYLKNTYKGGTKDPNGAFKDKMKSFLELEYGVAMHVNVEKNEMKKYVRYIVTTDPFPSNRQHFSEEAKDAGKDVLKTHRAKDVDCFYISLFRTTRFCYFQIKCDYDLRQRKIIADYFAKYVLTTDVGVKPVQERRLDAFKERPKKFDLSDVDGFVSLRYEGVNMRIQSGGRKKDVYTRRFTNEDFYDAVERSGELKDVPPEAKELIELYLEITLKTGERERSVQTLLDGFGEEDTRKEKTYLVTVKAHGFWTAKPTISECDEKKVDQVLELMELQDTAGQKILNKKIRK